MGKRPRPRGMFHVCGSFGELSFDHVPPRAAFNDRRVIVYRGESAIGLGPDGVLTGGRIQQRGMGAYTLCERCNSTTGRWYGRRFVSWCYRSMEILIRSAGSPGLVYVQNLYPLAILKQIVVMFLSMNTDQLRAGHPDLVRFALNPKSRDLPDRYRFFVYYSTSSRHRYTPVVVQSKAGRISVVSEFSFPPFGYVLTLGSPPPDGRVAEITHFKRYRFNELVSLPIELRVLPTYTPWPGDHRTAEEVAREVARNARDRESA